MTNTIGNPLSWSVDHIRASGRKLGSAAGRVSGAREEELPRIRRIEIADLRQVLRAGLDDFAACRSDVLFICILYPVMGLVLAWFALDRNLIPLLFPLISGFALVGPVAAVGLYAMSRQREQGRAANWGDAFAVVRSPSFGAIFVLGLLLVAIFVVWMLTAWGIYAATLGPEAPASVGAFAREAVTTAAGWAMIVIGMAVGLLFALLVLAIGVVSFPLLLDRDVGVAGAVTTSFRVAALNPGPVGAWGLIVAIGLAIGSVPFLLGLIFVMPILGHATWHLYRRTVVAEPGTAPAEAGEIPARA